MRPVWTAARPGVLRHGMKRENGVRRHWKLGSDIAHAKALQVDGPAMLLDKDNGAGQLSCCNFVVKKAGDGLELFRCRRGRISRAGCTASGAKRE